MTTPLTTDDIDLQTRLLDSAGARKEGQRIEARTYLDLSPEQVLLDHLALRIQAQKVGAQMDIPPLPPTWRKRLALITT